MSIQAWAALIRVHLSDLVKHKEQLLRQLGSFDKAPHDCTFDRYYAAITFHLDSPSRFEAYQQASQLVARLRAQLEPLSLTVEEFDVKAVAEESGDLSTFR